MINKFYFILGFLVLLMLSPISIAVGQIDIHNRIKGAIYQH
jgi:hypothetical protein